MPGGDEDAPARRLQPLVGRSHRPKVLRFREGAVDTTLGDGSYEAGFRGNAWTGLYFLTPFTVLSGRVVDGLCVEGRFAWTQKKLDAELDRGTMVALSKRFGFNCRRHPARAEARPRLSAPRL